MATVQVNKNSTLCLVLVCHCCNHAWLTSANASATAFEMVLEVFVNCCVFEAATAVTLPAQQAT